MKERRRMVSGLRRVVITGIGAVSPLGCGIEHIWSRLLAGDCGISPLPNDLLPPGSGVYVAGQVPISNDDNNDNPTAYNEKSVFGRIVSKEMSKLTQYGLYASDLALLHAGSPLKDMTSLELEHVGVVLATGGVGSISDIIDSSKSLEKSYRKLSPYFIPKVLTNMVAGHISLRHGLKGPLLSPSTACAASSHAIGDAYNLIRMGYSNIILAGGTESCIDPLSILGFARMRALTSNQDPYTSSKPFDKNRNGFVIAEGACVLILEEYEHAIKRNAPIIAEICGYGLSSDSHHITSPSPTGDGAIRSMKMALNDANINIHQIGYVNAHATSTPVGDSIEANAVASMVMAIDTSSNSNSNSNSSSNHRHDKILISSTKGSTGHLLGAAGALESAFTALAIRDNIVPPTLNLNEIDCGNSNVTDSLTFVANKSVTIEVDVEDKKQGLQYALKNSFGFGGTNASIVFGKIKP
jgi:3-oxoacyl-[acyl-carrier-protein] synthase II